MLNFADTNASAHHPFVGLRPFDYADGSYFFGREEMVTTLEELVDRGRMVSVVGSSGSGKSSLVRAGLLHRLSVGERVPIWNWVSMRPGESPIRRLAEALANPNVTDGLHFMNALAAARADRIELVLQRSSFGIAEALQEIRWSADRQLLIVVDQFEEIFRFADLRTQRNRDPRRAAEQRDEATFFVQLLLNAARSAEFPGSILITMRSDFIGECARFHGLSEIVTETQFLVPALTRDQRARAIRGPVAKAGGSIDPVLVQRLLNDSDEDPDQLPVMQHVLMRCWDQAAAKADLDPAPHLTLDDYHAVGGIDGALTRHGDEMLQALASHESGIAGLVDTTKRVFQCLTEVDSQGRVIRRPQTLADLVSVLAPEDDPARAGVERAVRLVVLHFAAPSCSFLRAPTADELRPDAIIDIGHEALIRRWERLGGLDQTTWVREEQRDAERYLNLLVYARDDGLIPAAQLASLERWWAERRPTRFWARRYSRAGEDMLDAARDVLDRSHREIERSRREARRRRRNQWIVRGCIAALVLYLIASSYAEQIYRARTAQKAASDSALKRARTVAAEGIDEMRRLPYQALLMAKWALDQERSTGVELPESKALAYEALDRMRERIVFDVGYSNAPSLAFAADGTLLTFGQSGTIDRWNAETGEKGEPLPAPLIPFGFLSAPVEGHLVLLNGIDQIHLIDTHPNAKPPQLAATTILGIGAFSANGKLIAAIRRNGEDFRLWTVAEPTPGQVEIAPRSDLLPLDDIKNVSALAISPDASLVALGSFDSGEVRIVDVAGTAPTRKLHPIGTGVTSLAFNPQDPRLLLATYQGRGARQQIWKLSDTDSASQDLNAEGTFLRGAWSPDGRYIAITSFSNVIKVWDHAAPRSEPTWIVQGPEGASFFSAIFDKQNHLLGGSQQGMIWVWDIEPALSRNVPLDDPVAAGAAAVQAATVLQPTDRQAFRVVSSVPSVADGASIEPPSKEFAAATKSATVSSDGIWALITPDAGPILLYDLRVPSSPMAALGRSLKGKLTNARFSRSMDRVLAEDAAGDTHAWRFFTRSNDLLEFINESLPTVCGVKATLARELRDKIDADFWPVLATIKDGSTRASKCDVR